MNSNMQSMANTNTQQHDLKSVLERWTNIETFTWNSDDKILKMEMLRADYLNSDGAFVKQYLLPSALLSKSAILRQKLNNFNLMRADLEVELKVNATPFQQGALRLAYSPKSLEASRFRAVGSEFMASVTTLPGKTLVLGVQDCIRETFPFANVADYLDLTKESENYGVVNIYVLAPLAGALGYETCDITVRMRFVNIQLEIPTNSSLYQIAKYRDLEIQRHTTQNRRRAVPQGLRAEIHEGESTGPVTQISSGIATLAAKAANLPIIGRAAGMVAWFARGVNGVASSFGWSKPIDLAQPEPIYNRPAAYMGNLEGKDASVCLAAIADNSIDSSTMVPSGTDEMTLDYVLKRPNTIGRIRVPVDIFKAGRLLFSLNVSPFHYLTQLLESNGQDFVFGSFSFASALFAYWRGSIKYQLHAIKTQYHSARIVVVYFPNQTRSEIPDELGELITTNSNFIYDLKAEDGDDKSLAIPFTIPYSSASPWKRTLWKDPDTDLYDSSTQESANGTIGVYCLNELVCPEAVAQEVTFLLDIAAGDDYEVAYPRLQLAGGFAVATPPVDPTQFLVTELNRLYGGGLQLTASSSAFDKPLTVYELTDVVVASTDTESTWEYLSGLEANYSDGDYTASILVDPGNYEAVAVAQTLIFTMTIVDRMITKLTSTVMVGAQANDKSDFAMTFSAPSGLRAEGSDGVDDFPSAAIIAGSDPTRSVSVGTTGEYVKSLRALMKRFTRVAEFDGTAVVSYQPTSFTNYTGTTLNIGNRSWEGENPGGGNLPESWLNMVSYLYRFMAGGSRTKIFMRAGDYISSSNQLSETPAVGFDAPLEDPEFLQAGNLNNVMETTIPFYSQYRARVVSDLPEGSISKQRIEFNRQGRYPLYEAASDDTNFWFLIGPPVMRPRDVDRINIPIIKPPTATHYRSSLAQREKIRRTWAQQSQDEYRIYT
nr:MAG: polyprotein 2 [Picornavirales sp.]